MDLWRGGGRWRFRGKGEACGGDVGGSKYLGGGGENLIGSVFFFESIRLSPLEVGIGLEPRAWDLHADACATGIGCRSALWYIE